MAPRKFEIADDVRILILLENAALEHAVKGPGFLPASSLWLSTAVLWCSTALQPECLGTIQGARWRALSPNRMSALGSTLVLRWPIKKIKHRRIPFHYSSQGWLQTEGEHLERYVQSRICVTFLTQRRNTQLCSADRQCSPDALL